MPKTKIPADAWEVVTQLRRDSSFDTGNARAVFQARRGALQAWFEDPNEEYNPFDAYANGLIYGFEITEAKYPGADSLFDFD